MSRYTDRDSDEERLPEHFKRVGYDADTQIYTFEDTSTGRLYESAPGNRYDVLTPAGESQSQSQPQDRDPYEIEAHNAQIKKGNKEAVRMMLPFALLAVVSLLLLFKFLYGGAAPEDAPKVNCGRGAAAVTVQKGDTCWEIGKAHGVGVDELLALTGNAGVDCDHLHIGQGICVPA